MHDIICTEVISINHSGIKVRDKNKDVTINFEECAKNYANEMSFETSKCVATRDITNLTFIFYTQPKIKLVFKKHFFNDLFSRKTAINKFLELQKAINKYGFTSYDLS